MYVGPMYVTSLCSATTYERGIETLASSYIGRRYLSEADVDGSVERAPADAANAAAHARCFQRSSAWLCCRVSTVAAATDQCFDDDDEDDKRRQRTTPTE